MKAQVFTYFHNVLYFQQPPVFPLKEKITLIIKYWIIKFFSNNTDYIIVQTDYVKKLVTKYLRKNSLEILTIPFYKKSDSSSKEKIKDKFVYVSNGNSHKNHILLLKAWNILYDKGYKFELHLTIEDRFSKVLEAIENYKSKGVNIINHSFIKADELYKDAQFMVYPSFIESFGLPLVEAAKMDCEIIASDLPFVYEVIDPMEVFNPTDPISISDAVIRAIQKKNDNLITRLKISNKINELVNLLKE